MKKHLLMRKLLQAHKGTFLMDKDGHDSNEEKDRPKKSQLKNPKKNLKALNDENEDTDYDDFYDYDEDE